VLVNRANPYARFVPRSKAGSDTSLGPVNLYGEPLEEAIARLEGSELPGSRFRLAEILMRNCWVTPEAISLYAEAAAAAPDEVHFVTTLADRASYLGMPEIAIEPLKRLGPAAFLRVGWAYERSGQSEDAGDYYRRALARDPGSREAKSGLDRIARSQNSGKG
jgi:tetratricopeptide (TPR) repeat protein